LKFYVPRGLALIDIKPSKLTAAAGALGAALVALLIGTGAAMAAMGQPTDGQISLQLPASVVATEIQWFYDYVTWILIAITLFVLALMVYVLVRFNEKSNPTPSRFTHNTTVEVVWTVVPVLILIAIGIPSFKLLYLQYQYPKPEVVVKSIGNAWFWEHEYPDEDVSIVQNMLTDEAVITAAIGSDEFNTRFGNLEGTARSKALFEASQPYWAQMKAQRQLAVDNPIAVPVNKVVHVLVTSNDVIHGWAVPSLGSRVQAVPGRTTATWFKATKTGAFYGQCAVLCGQFHASMPIAIHVVEESVYQQWLEAQKAGDSEAAKKILEDALPNSDTAKTVAGKADAKPTRQIATLAN
jgi:cytochrome c oxidase subunit 2